ncbi:hypothetical protein T440DRAFT_470678 [Plenodomus tracheiphilus IPT5]|uniref:Uncharacterized protein n=1 Tax=Plenodomus tracheiphilus IPT5 TaxID=1408161 RepID=A0A6A7AZR4_9PLEO|nr:hypothetical protein T440DRAFT_470678 [Plenodomus tracheiphilus IPT5]
MEPPAKRLRILQAVDVDEENEEYINAKKAQEEKLKSRMESIFAKYENMHDSNSDIIDMKKNEVVLDRGHLRRLQRQSARNETSLLDTLGYSASKEEDFPPAEDDIDHKEESEDELAPTQRPKAAKSDPKERRSAIQPIQTPMFAQVQPSPQQAPYTPVPAANLLQYVRFPQTPAGQQAQSAFYTTLTQTINQAVQQAVAPLFSGVLSNTPIPQTSSVQTLPPIHITPSLRDDTVAPATDPKWFFPALPMESPNTEVTPSTSFPDPGIVKKSDVTNREVNETTFPAIPTKLSELQQLGHGPPVAHRQESSSDIVPRMTPSRRIPRVEIQRRRGSTSKYHFSKDDDMHISKKVLESYSWAEIRDSQAKWRTWPLTVFQDRWNSRLKQQNLHLQTATKKIMQDNSEDLFDLPHHLPTPSSSRHEDRIDGSAEPINTHDAGLITSSIGHYDDDELELLSIAGDEDPELPEVGDEDELQQDIILPSIEAPLELVEEDTIQQALLRKSATIEPPSTVEREKKPAIKTAKKRRLSLDLHRGIPESKADAEDLPGHTTTDITTHYHTATPHKRQKSRRSTSIDLVGDEDELLAPVTPRIKRESSTPLPISFLCSTPAPKPRADLLLSESQSTPKISQKAFRKQVKQSWSKMGTPRPKSAGKTLVKRKSFPMLGRKRAWDGGGESEDELAM